MMILLISKVIRKTEETSTGSSMMICVRVVMVVFGKPELPERKNEIIQWGNNILFLYTCLKQP